MRYVKPQGPRVTLAELLGVADGAVEALARPTSVAVIIGVSLKARAHELGEAVVNHAVSKGGGADEARLSVTNPKMSKGPRLIAPLQELTAQGVDLTLKLTHKG